MSCSQAELWNRLKCWREWEGGEQVAVKQQEVGGVVLWNLTGEEGSFGTTTATAQTVGVRLKSRAMVREETLETRDVLMIPSDEQLQVVDGVRTMTRSKCSAGFAGQNALGKSLSLSPCFFALCSLLLAGQGGVAWQRLQV